MYIYSPNSTPLGSIYGIFTYMHGWFFVWSIIGRDIQIVPWILYGIPLDSSIPLPHFYGSHKKRNPTKKTLNPFFAADFAWDLHSLKLTATAPKKHVGFQWESPNFQGSPIFRGDLLRPAPSCQSCMVAGLNPKANIPDLNAETTRENTKVFRPDRVSRWFFSNCSTWFFD